MSTHLDESATEVRYLLGELSEEAAESFEHSFFADDRVFDELQASESEVIDAYVANQLTSKQRQHFQKRVALSARLQERVAFARAFAQSTAAGKTAFDPASARRAVRESWWKKVFAVPVLGPLTPAGAFATVVIVLSLTAIIVQSIRLRNASRRLEGERAVLERHRDELARLAAEERNQMASELRDAQARAERAEELVKSLQKGERQVPPPKQPSVFASLSLLPGSVRSGGGGNDLLIPPGATGVRLKLVLLRVDYRSYQVTIRGAGNYEIHRAGLRPRKDKTLALNLPANLAPGQYTVQVSGVTGNGNVEFAGDYVFGVVRK